MTIRSLVWFRGKELRVSDHAPLATAARDGEVIPVFALDPYFFAPGRARRLAHRIQFLLESLTSLEHSLAHLGSRLLIAIQGFFSAPSAQIARAVRTMSRRATPTSSPSRGSCA